MMNIEVGNPFFTHKERISEAMKYGLGKGLTSKDIVDFIQDIQEDTVDSTYKKYSGNMSLVAKDLFGAANVPNDVAKAVEDKFTIIKNMLETAAGNAAAKGVYTLAVDEKTGLPSKQISYETDKGIIKFLGDVPINKQQLGNFFQDVLIFNNVSSPGNSPLPDIPGVAEIKETQRAGEIKVASYTIAMIIDESEPSIEKARDILLEAEKMEAMALLELYIKMKNLLLIISEPYSPGGTAISRQYVFVAMALYVELKIREIRKLVKRGIAEAMTSPQKHFIPNSGDYLKDTSTSPGPIVRFERLTSDFETVEVSGKITVQETFKISMENLDFYATFEGGALSRNKINPMMQTFKTLQNLYTKRYDMITYDNNIFKRQRKGTSFYMSLTDKTMPSFGFDRSKLT